MGKSKQMGKNKINLTIPKINEYSKYIPNGEHPQNKSKCSETSKHVVHRSFQKYCVNSIDEAYSKRTNVEMRTILQVQGATNSLNKRQKHIV